MINRSSFVPISVQVCDIICNRIIQGAYPLNSLLPPQGAFVTEFNVSSITVRRAFQELYARNLVKPQRGRGTVVVGVPSTYQGFHSARGFTVDSRITHSSLETKILEISSSCIKREATDAFGLTEDRKSFLIKRLRIIEGTSASLEFSYLNPTLFPNTDWINEIKDNSSLYEFIKQRYGYQIIRAEEQILPILPLPHVQEILHTTAPVLFVKRCTFIKNSPCPFEYCEYYILGKYYGRVIYSVGY